VKIMRDAATTWASPTISPDRQVKCRNGNNGVRFMQSHYDELPFAVRQRLAESPFNICSACMTLEAYRRVGSDDLFMSRRGRRPSVKVFIETIEDIEREMRKTYDYD
jgi:hypothetical protein